MNVKDLDTNTWIGLIAIISIIMFGMTKCDDNNKAFELKKLEIKQQMYTERQLK